MTSRQNPVSNSEMRNFLHTLRVLSPTPAGRVHVRPISRNQALARKRPTGRPTQIKVQIGAQIGQKDHSRTDLMRQEKSPVVFPVVFDRRQMHRHDVFGLFEKREKTKF